MTIASFAVIAAVAATSFVRAADLCTSCRCTTIGVSPNDEEFAEVLDPQGWSPIVSASDPAGKFLDVDCSNRGAGWKWPAIEVSGMCVSFEGGRLESVPEIPEKVENKILKLELGKNRISKITPGDFESYLRLKVLDLSGNLIRYVADASFSKTKNLTKLDLSGNQIVDLGKWLPEANVKYLDVSRNRLSRIEPGNCRGSRDLKLLDLSGNELSALPDDFGRLFPNLKYLHLAENRFEKTPRLPRSLTSLNISSNVLNTLALPQTDQLLVLDVSNNSLNGLGNLYEKLTLEVLTANHNRLSEFGKWNNFNLKVLNLAYNNLKTIPEEINSENLPRLQELYLDGNPIKELVHNRKAKGFPDLYILGLSNLGNITAISQESFTGIIMESYINCSEEEGLFVDLSKNKLKNIDSNTFKTFPICSIDLSENRLTSIPETLLSWSDLRSADLQNNPWNCVCDLQWMLHTYVPHFYKTRPEMLFNLRCSSPSRFKNKMFVFWYNATRNVFCTGNSYYQYEYSSGKYIEIWTIDLIVSIFLGVLIVVLIVVIAVLLLTGRRRMKAVKAKKMQKEKRSKPLFCELRPGKELKYNEISQDAAF